MLTNLNRRNLAASSQVNAVTLRDMLAYRDADRAQRVMEAMLKMDKLDIANLNGAYYGRSCNSYAFVIFLLS